MERLKISIRFAYLKKMITFAKNNKEAYQMATPVKIISTLHGKSARAFIEHAEERERNPHTTRIYTDNEEKAFYNMLKESGML